MKLLKGVCGVIAALTIVSTIAAQDTDQTKTDMQNLQGIWRVVSSQFVDENASENEVDNRKVTVMGNILIYQYGNRENDTQEGFIKLNPKQKAFDWTLTSPQQGVTLLAIYELNGDDLRIGIKNDGLVRPRQFVAGREDVVWLAVLKRVKPRPTGS
jgi:uncharacterized protein (TIGR03067 family)